jgi:hypothetical protein
MTEPPTPVALHPEPPSTVQPSFGTRLKQLQPRPRAALVWLGMGAVSLVFWHAAFRRLSSTGDHDWPYYVQLWETSRVGIQRFGELALWNPYQCGGITLWGNPQQWSFSPLFYPTLFLGTALALKVRLVLLNMLGLVGMYVLARRVHRISPLGSLLAAVPWACSGFFSWHNLAGHAAFQTFWLFPWVLYLSRRAERDARFSAATAGLIFFIAIDGGSYPLPYLALLLGADVVFRLVGAKRGERLQMVAALAWTGMLALLLASLRLVPSLVMLARNPRNLADRDAIDLAEVLVILTARSHEWRFDPHQYHWHEYACFVGWTVLGLGLSGLVLGLRKWPVLVAGAVLFFLCMLGHVAPYFPWPLLKRLPVLDSLRIPSRFVVLFTLYLALLAGLFLDWLRAWLSRRGPLRSGALGTLLAAALTTGAIVDLFAVNLSVNDFWGGPDLPTEPPAGPYHLIPAQPVREFRASFSSFPQQERGTALCFEPLPWPIPHRLWTGDVAQARVRGEGSVLDWGHTTNTLWADVDLKAPARVVFNQTFAPGWLSSQGSLVDDAGRIAVDAAPGKYRLQLRFRPPELAASVGITLIGLLLALLTAVFATPERLARLTSRRHASPPRASEAGPLPDPSSRQESSG